MAKKWEKELVEKQREALEEKLRISCRGNLDRKKQILQSFDATIKEETIYQYCNLSAAQLEKLILMGKLQPQTLFPA